MSTLTCINCNSALVKLSVGAVNNSVTSDCRVWPETENIYRCQQCALVQKAPLKSYQQSIAEIYQSYLTYRFNSCSGPQHYSADIPRNRAHEIASIFFKSIAVPLNTWLDVGTGSGALLRGVAAQRDDIQLYAQDVSDHEKQLIEQIPGVQAFIHQELADIRQKFDVVSVVHVLEHVLTLHEFLEDVKGKLTSRGAVLIQVPNIIENPYDLIVYDHVSHFSFHTLFAVLRQHFRYVFIPAKQIKKEITILASDADVFVGETTRVTEEEGNLEQLQKLNNLFSSYQNTPVGVFSTGPVGIYVGANMGEQLQYFVDEDPDKIGLHCLEVPIFAPSECSADVPILLPLPEYQRYQVKQRYPDIQFIEP